MTLLEISSELSLTIIIKVMAGFISYIQICHPPARKKVEEDK